MNRRRSKPARAHGDHGQTTAGRSEFFRLEQRVRDLPDQGGVSASGQSHAGIGRQFPVSGDIARPVLGDDHRGQAARETDHGAEAAFICHFGGEHQQHAFLGGAVQQDQPTTAQLGDSAVNMGLGR